MTKPQAQAGETCPLHNKDVSKVCHNCAWYIHMRGQNPQTGVEMDQWACSLSFLPILLVEVARTSRGTSAAVESFRNEIVRSAQLAIQQTRARSMSWQLRRYLPNFRQSSPDGQG